ncbi:hypothetical protein [Alienimonas californiensis]|uniref:Uncharacterized protein n=1 Tax=Alienimonas californiensis TaxID=2527989 RepID=A0A517PFJ4_9PLAN|nr:hypothetical protein [Alienimonas californiensis]QDT18124.1 hypothetical protein CA12_42640 [Alienimonas californiensis]
MQQIKFFKATEADLTSLETEMNDWLRDSGAKVVQVFGNIAPQTVVPDDASHGLTKSAFAPSDVLMAVVYEPNAG